MRYSLHDDQIEQGSIMLLYTDGLIERRSRALDTGSDLLQAAAEASQDDTDRPSSATT